MLVHFITELPNTVNLKEYGTVGTSLFYRINSATLQFQGVGSQTKFRNEACKPERLAGPRLSTFSLHYLHMVLT